MAIIQKSELEIASERLTPQWLAGFFDGEGCVSITNRHNGLKGGKKPYPRLSVTITQAEPTLLSLIGMKFCDERGLIYCPVRKGNKREKKACYSLRMSGKHAGPFLKYIQPYVILKRKLVDWGIEMAELTGERGKRNLLNPEIKQRREEIMSAVTSENQAERKISIVATRKVG